MDAIADSRNDGDPLQRHRSLLSSLGFPERDEVTASPARFPDGASYRVEVPSVEGPETLAAVFDAADQYGVPVHRVSQGSGAMLLTEDEIRTMVQMCADRNVELSLFVGPRPAWDASAQRQFGGNRVEGSDQLAYAMDDLVRAADLGVRGALLTDEGMIAVAGQMKRTGALPAEFVIKGSVQLMASNPASVKLLADAGLDTINVPPGMTIARLCSIRGAVSIPIDFYVESPDTMGGFIRNYEIWQLTLSLAPIYLKFGLRNHPDVYPSGGHLQSLNTALARERVRRARLGLDLLERLGGGFAMTPLDADPAETLLGVPVP